MRREPTGRQKSVAGQQNQHNKLGSDAGSTSSNQTWMIPVDEHLVLTFFAEMLLTQPRVKISPIFNTDIFYHIRWKKTRNLSYLEAGNNESSAFLVCVCLKNDLIYLLLLRMSEYSE